MTERQHRFAELYAANPNATAAAVAAGYSARTAYSQGERLLRNVEVADYIQQLQAESSNKRIATVTETKELVTSVMRDENEKTTNRIKAATLLMKSADAFLAMTNPGPADSGGDTIDEGDEISIVLPWDGRAIPRAIELPDGTLKPLMDAGRDVLIFITRQQINLMNSVFSVNEAVGEVETNVAL